MNRKKEKHARILHEKQNNINQLDFIRMKRQSKEGLYLKYKKMNVLKVQQERVYMTGTKSSRGR